MSPDPAHSLDGLSPEQRLAALGIELPPAAAGVGDYAPTSIIGNLLMTSGQLPWIAGDLKFKGKIGSDLTVEQGRGYLSVDRAKRAWDDLTSDRARIEFLKQQVKSAEIARQSIITERSVGTRTTLDQLISEQDWVDADTALLQAQHDEAIATFSPVSVPGSRSGCFPRTSAMGWAMPAR